MAVAAAAWDLLSSVSSDQTTLIDSILTIVVMLLFFTGAALCETSYWNKRIRTLFYALEIPLGAAFLIIIGAQIGLALTGK